MGTRNAGDLQLAHFPDPRSKHTTPYFTTESRPGYAINLSSTQVEIPQRPLTHTEASRLVGGAYEMEQKARILHTWAHRQLSDAKKNVE